MMKTVQSRVEVLLKLYPEMRGDDFKLVARYYRDFCGVTDTMPFYWVMNCHNNYGLPAFDTIRRTRQKLQEHKPWLRPENDKQVIRKEHETVVKDYALTPMEKGDPYDVADEIRDRRYDREMEAKYGF